MKRIIWPLLWAAATAYMYHHNTTDTGSVMMLPMIDMLFAETAGDPKAMGEASVKTMAGLTVLMVIYEIFDALRAARRAKKQRAEESAQ